jgi:hypothetical protein
MEALRADYTEAWLPRPMLPLVQFADRTRALADTGIDLVGLGDGGRALKAFAEFDEIVSWYGSAQDAFRDAVRHLPFRFFPALPPPPGQPRIRVPAAARGGVVIHPFSASSRKNWPLDRFRKVAANTRASWAVNPEDGEPIICDLYQLACWLAAAEVYVGNDSGITHLASAVGTPVVVLFGPMDPAIWKPRGDIVELIHQPNLEGISVEDVLAAVDRARNAHPDARRRAAQDRRYP